MLSGLLNHFISWVKKSFILLGAVFAVGLSLQHSGFVAQAEAEAGYTGPQKADPQTAKKILDNLRAARADIAFSENVETSPFPGVYRVQVERGPLLFVSEDGKHFIAGGELYGVVKGDFVNLLEEELKPKRVEMLSRVKKEDQIIFSPKGKAKAYVSVFTDVDCGFCRKLHKEVPALNEKGIEVRYMAYPRAGLKSPSYDKIATAWCASERQQVLTRLKNREPVPVKTCDDNPIAGQLALGIKLGIQGTPALILADGSLIPGYMSADELAKMLGVE